MTSFILTLLICHFINDFIFQTKTMVKNKNNFKFYAHLIHSFLGTFFTFIICFFILNLTFVENLRLAIFLFLSHLILDFIKCFFNKYIKNPNIEFFLFVLDQLVHLIIVINIAQFLFKNKFTLSNPIIIKNQLLIITFLFISFGSSVIIGNILNIIYYPFNNYNDKFQELIILHSTYNEEKKTTQEFKDLPIGKTIGILERSLIFIAILTLQLKNAGFIITGLLTLKSLTRFKFMEIKIFSEFYLIGTLLSFFLALLPFFIANLIDNKIIFIEEVISYLTLNFF